MHKTQHSMFTLACLMEEKSLSYSQALISEVKNNTVP